MGLYDRQYYREEDDERSGVFASNLSVVARLIILNIGVFFVDFLSRGELGAWLSAYATLPRHPWFAWQLLTAGFAHDTTNVWHLLWNMYFLWLFGGEVERHYGRREFTLIYLALLVLASLTWVVCENIAYGFAPPPGDRMLGASGAVMGMAVIYACNFPRRVLMLLGIIPVQVWILVSLYVMFDLLQALQVGRGSGTAVTAHLGGAVFGFLYFQSRFKLEDWFHGPSLKRLFKRGPKLRVHRPEEDADLSARVDRVLEKISREGEASLTRAERKLLESASRKYQQRRS
ncbi:MAG: rhomboid family intramembrane serine protease [Pirellulales bacterium]|nr:rhomboid family intramembrane serine protease [Pirellulales bacterium]